MTVANLEPLLYFIREREALRLRKESGAPPPWSSDPVLNEYRFCNVRRRDDRVSRWLQLHVLREEYLDRDPQAFLLFTALCRHVNWPPTLDDIMKRGLWPTQWPAQFNLPAIGNLIDQRRAGGKKAWTGAYMVRAEPGNGQGKGWYVATHVIAPMAGITDAILDLIKGSTMPTRYAVWEMLTSLRGWGSFMAGQVIDDWTWTPLLDRASDLHSWAPLGPGSARGFNRLMGRPITARIEVEEWLNAIQAWRAEVIAQLGPNFADLTAADIQNNLCETDKFLRVKNGEGRPRARYRPETAY